MVTEKAGREINSPAETGSVFFPYLKEIYPLTHPHFLNHPFSCTLQLELQPSQSFAFLLSVPHFEVCCLCPFVFPNSARLSTAANHPLHFQLLQPDTNWWHKELNKVNLPSKDKKTVPKESRGSEQSPIANSFTKEDAGSPDYNLQKHCRGAPLPQPVAAIWYRMWRRKLWGLRWKTPCYWMLSLSILFFFKEQLDSWWKWTI